MTIQTFAELIDSAMDEAAADMNSAFICKIISYDYLQSRANIQPVVSKKLRDGKTEEQPVIPNVPVWFPRSGGVSITLPVLTGDYGIAVCTDRSMDEWLETGNNGAPQDRRKHAITDCAVMVGVNPFSMPSRAENNTDLLIDYDGTIIRIKPAGAVEIEAKTVTVTADSIDITAPDVTIDGDVTVSGDVVASGISLVTHTHSGVEPGAGNTGPPAP